jgi:hypothetical protein
MNQASTTEINPAPALEIKKTDVVRLKRPYCPREGLRLQVGIVEEVLGEGTLFGIKFNNYPNVCDFGRSLIDCVIPDPLDTRAE